MSLVKKVLLASLIGLFCLVFLEVLLQVHFRSANGQWLFATQSNFKVPYVAPVSDRRHYVLKPGFRNESISINKLGFRGKLPEKNDRQPLICFIGDSVPYGAGVEDNETLPVHLERLLQRDGLTVSVLNGGVPSYNLRQSLDRWRLDIAPRWKCSLIILNAANDVSLYDYYGESWTPDYTWANHRFGISAPSWSGLAHYIRASFQNLSPTVKQLPINKFMKNLSEDFEDNLRWPQNQRIPIILLPVVPCYYAADLVNAESSASCAGYKNYEEIAKKWQSKIEAVNIVLKNAATAKGLHYLDTAAYLDGNGREGKFVDFIHFSDDGARAVARFIRDYIVQRKLL